MRDSLFPTISIQREQRHKLFSLVFVSMMNSILTNKGYTYVRELAKGGTSKVFLLRDSIGGELVACKKIHTCHDKSLVMGQKKCIMVQDVNREVNFMKRLDDVDGVCKYVDSFKDDDYMYILTRAYLGGTIHDYLDCSDKNTRELCVKRISWRLLHILKDIHDKNVIHNDIKPENLLFGTMAKLDTMHLLDFGSAVDAKQPVLGHMFTPLYMPIEILSQEVDKKSDCWQVGIMLYYLLSRVSFPFNDKHNPFNPSLYKVWNSIQNDSVEFESEAWETVSKEAHDLILELLEKKVKNRISVEEALAHPWFNEIL